MESGSGMAGGVLAAGEGIETVPSVRAALPGLPMLAALSAAISLPSGFPPGPRRLYVVCDRDPGGDAARETLFARATALGIEAVALAPVRGDFKHLRGFGLGALRAGLRAQLRPENVERYLPRSGTRGGCQEGRPSPLHIPVLFAAAPLGRSPARTCSIAN